MACIIPVEGKWCAQGRREEHEEQTNDFREEVRRRRPRSSHSQRAPAKMKSTNAFIFGD
jgi:hypothetical protein